MTATTAASPNVSETDLTLRSGLPVSLQGATTTVTPVAAGNSGAGVFLVDDRNTKSVLKVTPPNEEIEAWRRAAATQRAAADAGVAPRVLHVDEERRSVLSEHVVDRSFAALYWNPATRADAIAMLARTARAVHGIAPQPTHPNADPLGTLANFRDMMEGPDSATPVVPDFALNAWHSIVTARVPDADREMRLCHNDMNPSNLVFDGERLLLFDWQTTAMNDPYYDLGTIALFLRMDEETTLQFVSAYDATSVTTIPPRLSYFRRMSAALSGSAFLHTARLRGYYMPDLGMSIEAAPTLGEIYAELRSGALNLGMAEAQWRFGLALLKESVEARI